MEAQQGRIICLIEYINKVQISLGRIESTEPQHELYTAARPPKTSVIISDLESKQLHHSKPSFNQQIPHIHFTSLDTEITWIFNVLSNTVSGTLRCSPRYQVHEVMGV